MTQTVFLGVDFGTSFTKIAFQVLPSAVKDIISIPYETADNPFFPSVVYYNPITESLSWNKEPDTIEVKYFKYALAFKELDIPAAKQMQCDNSKKAAELCSIFYLACLFHTVRRTIEPYVLHHGEPPTSLRWAVNMGIPTKSIKNEIVDIYKNVLQCAWALSFDSSVDSYRMTVSDLCKKRSELLKSHIGAHLNVVPELFAEVLLYHQNPNIPEGLYTVVDIGGGTMDISTFQKARREKKWTVFCMSESVAPLGVEIVNNQCHFEPMIRKTYGSCVWTARNKIQTALQNGLPHKWFLLGGGRTVQIYRDSISTMAKAHSEMGISNQSEGDVENLIPKQWVHNPIGARPDRLITSQMLAQPFGAIPSVEGNPNAITPLFQVGNSLNDFMYGITDT